MWSESFSTGTFSHCDGLLTTMTSRVARSVWTREPFRWRCGISMVQLVWQTNWIVTPPEFLFASRRQRLGYRPTKSETRRESGRNVVPSGVALVYAVYGAAGNSH